MEDPLLDYLFFFFKFNGKEDTDHRFAGNRISDSFVGLIYDGMFKPSILANTATSPPGGAN